MVFFFITALATATVGTVLALTARSLAVLFTPTYFTDKLDHLLVLGVA